MRRVLLLAFLASFLFLAACVSPPPSPPGQPVNAPSVVEQNLTPPPAPPAPAADLSPCQDAGNVLLRDQCYQKTASERRDIAWCDRIYSSTIKDGCLLYFTPENASLCDRIADSSTRQGCLDSAARRLNDTNLCVRLTDADRKHACLVALSPPCSFEPTPAATQLCLALRNSNFSYCQNNLCYFEYGVQKNSGAACDMLSGERAWQLACSAIVKHDRSMCNADNISTIADYCFQLAAYRLNDSNWCDDAQSSSPYRNQCYIHFAVQALDSTVCRRSEPETGRDDCYLNYSVTTDSPAACVKVINSLNRNKCYIDTAKANGDPAACNGLLAGDQKICYNLVLGGEKPLPGLHYCRDVADDLWRDKCYLAFATQQNNRTVCDLIVSPDYQQSCQLRFS